MAFWSFDCGNVPAVITVLPAIATGVLVPAGSWALQSTLPVFVLTAQSLPSNVVVKATSLVSLAAP